MEKIVSRDGNSMTVGSGGTAAECTGMYANLFYYNPDLRTLEFICAGQIGEDGTADLPFVHASDYTVILSEYSMGSTDSSEDPQELPETENPQGSEDASGAQFKSLKLRRFYRKMGQKDRADEWVPDPVFRGCRI